jgi:hypothetical protein
MPAMATPPYDPDWVAECSETEPPGIADCYTDFCNFYADMELDACRTRFYAEDALMENIYGEGNYWCEVETEEPACEEFENGCTLPVSDYVCNITCTPWWWAVNYNKNPDLYTLLENLSAALR